MVVFGPPICMGRGIPDFGHAFSNYTYFRPCGRLSLSSAQRPRRQGGKKRKKKKKHWSNISPPTYYVGWPKNEESTAAKYIGLPPARPADAGPGGLNNRFLKELFSYVDLLLLLIKLNALFLVVNNFCKCCWANCSL